MHLPTLGVGVTYSSVLEPLLRAHPELVDVLEFEPQTTWVKSADGDCRPDEKVLQHLLTLPGRKLIHSVGAPVGGTVRPDPGHLQSLRETICYFDSPWVSDHLSFNQTPELATGFFLPPRQTQAGVELVVDSIRHLQAMLRVPVCVETGANYLRTRADELLDGEFVARVVEGADCGLLLDLHNIFTNSLNGRQPIDEYIEQLPLERVWEIHLAGGMELDGFYLDAHSGAIPDPLYSVAERLIPRLPNLGAMIFEIFPSFVSLVGLDLVEEQLKRLRKLWQLRTESRNGDRANLKSTLRRQASPTLPPVVVDPAPPEAWERALGQLVVGRRPEQDDALSRQLAEDPGVRLVEGLVHEFRASMIVGVLRLTSRLLMLALGPPAFRVILSDYWAATTPQMYATLEAEAFAAHLEKLNLRVPHLSRILAFERAVTMTLTDGQTRVVQFDFEPIPMLRALADGRLPDEVPRAGEFEIEVTPNGPTAATGLSLQDVQNAFHYH
jgi:uncharacterized protein (UPF0276 family)